MNKDLQGLFRIIVRAHNDGSLKRRNLLYLALTEDEKEEFVEYTWRHGMQIEGVFRNLKDIEYEMEIKPKVSEVDPVFTFWINNKIANERKYPAADVRQMFQEWLVKQDRDMIVGYPEVTIIGVFIGDKNGGLSAVQDSRQMGALLNVLLPDIRNYILGINPVTREPMFK